jgi:hypothetical protein
MGHTTKRRRSGIRTVLSLVTALGALAPAAAAFADTTSNQYCDNMCGETQRCYYVCCSIVTKPVGGANAPVGFRCNRSLCCAHPEGAGAITGGSTVKLPATSVGPTVGDVKTGLIESLPDDAANVKVESDDKAKVVTLTGTVATPAAKASAAKIAKKAAPRHKVANNLTVGEATPTQQAPAPKAP